LELTDEFIRSGWTGECSDFYQISFSLRSASAAKFRGLGDLNVKILLVASTLALIASAHAHSWYPRECCNEKDCHPVDIVKEMPDGSAQVQVEGETVIVPRSLKRRKSKDEHYHLCYEKKPEGISIFCFFQPGLS
jgi:hypothetical protein